MRKLHFELALLNFLIEESYFLNGKRSVGNIETRVCWMLGPD